MKSRKYLGIGSLLAGAVFLCNPILSVFDILPDFVGYLLILRGIYALADINVYLADARKSVKYLALSSLLRALSVLFVFGIASPREQGTMLVLAAFTFGVIDSYLIIKAWNNIFGGITYLATRNDGTAALKQIKNASATDGIRNKTLFSLIFIQVMALLPELVSLTDRSVYTDIDSATVDFSRFIGLLRGMAIIASITVGVIWLIKMFKYIKSLKEDEPFILRLSDKYASEVLSKPEIFTVRGINRAIMCIAAALILSVDFYDAGSFGCNIIPDVLSAVLMVVGILLIRKYVNQWIIPTAVCSFYGAYEIAVWLTQYSFFKNASAGDIFKSNAVYDAYYRMCAVTVAGEVIFFVALLFVLFAVHAVVQKHTGISAQSLSGFAHSAERTKYIRRALNIRLIIIGIMGWIAAASTITYFMSLPYAYRTFWEAFWILNMLICIVFAVMFISFSTELRERMEYKYGLF